jgi:lysophospholipase L1-like esterase
VGRPLPVAAVLARVGFSLALFLVASEIALRVAGEVLVPSRAEPPPAGAHVWCAGDSVTWGLGVRRAEAWPAQLERFGVPSGTVVNVAAPGAELAHVLDAQLTQVRDGDVVLVMAGHNDVVVFDGVARDTPAPEHLPWRTLASPWAPRLLRLAWYVASDAGVVDPTLLPDRVRRWDEGLDLLVRMGSSRGWRLRLLTYAVPGPTDPGDTRRAGFARQRKIQLALNEHMRERAARAGIPVIDVERAVPSGPRWTAAEFIDGIHPAPGVHARIAAAVAEVSRRSGDFAAP